MHSQSLRAEAGTLLNTVKFVWENVPATSKNVHVRICPTARRHPVNRNADNLKRRSTGAQETPDGKR